MLRFTEWLFVIEELSPFGHSIPLFEARRGGDDDIGLRLAIKDYSKVFKEWMQGLIDAHIFTNPENLEEARTLAANPAAFDFNFGRALVNIAKYNRAGRMEGHDLLDGMQEAAILVYNKLFDPDKWAGKTWEDRFPDAKVAKRLIGSIYKMGGFAAGHEARFLSGNVGEKRVRILSQDGEKELFKVSYTDANQFEIDGKAKWMDRSPGRPYMQALVPDSDIRQPTELPTQVHTSALQASRDDPFDPAAPESKEVEMRDQAQTAYRNLQTAIQAMETDPKKGSINWTKKLNKLKWALELARRVIEGGYNVSGAMQAMYDDAMKGPVDYPTDFPDSWLQRGGTQAEIAKLFKDAGGYQAESVLLALQEFRRWLYINA